VRLTLLFFSFALLAKPVTSAFPPNLSPELNSVVDRYVSATAKQREAMLGVQMEMDIDGRFTKLKEEGRMRVLRTISKLGELGIRVLEFTGDNRIKTELIARYLDEEQKAKAYGAMTIAPADYDFEIKAILKRGGQSTYVFDVTPSDKGAALQGGRRHRHADQRIRPDGQEPQSVFGEPPFHARIRAARRNRLRETL
jgi:hypothetical protein